MIGHSMGEYVAACLAGVISLRDGMALVALRGRLFETLPAGAHAQRAAVRGGAARRCWATSSSIAAVNAPDLCVASGPSAAIDALEARARARARSSTRRIHIDVAAHSRCSSRSSPSSSAFCRTIAFAAPTIPFVSNLTGTWITADRGDRSRLLGAPPARDRALRATGSARVLAGAGPRARSRSGRAAR